MLQTLWKPEGLQAKNCLPERENIDKKNNHDRQIPQPDNLQRQCAILKTEAVPTGALYDARALVQTCGFRIFPTELSRLLGDKQDVAHEEELIHTVTESRRSAQQQCGLPRSRSADPKGLLDRPRQLPHVWKPLLSKRKFTWIA